MMPLFNYSKYHKVTWNETRNGTELKYFIPTHVQLDELGCSCLDNILEKKVILEYPRYIFIFAL